MLSHLPNRPKHAARTADLRPRGADTNVIDVTDFGDGELGARNRAIWEARQREVYAEYGRAPAPSGNSRGGKRVAGVSKQRDAIAAFIAEHAGQVVRSKDVKAGVGFASSQSTYWLQHFQALGLVRRVRRGVWEVLRKGRA